jgi:PAS domain S-box-containing protein
MIDLDVSDDRMRVTNPDRVRTLPGSPLLLGVAVALAYILAANLGFRVATIAEQITTVWAPTGIAVATLLLCGTRLWPAVWVGAFVANLGADAPGWTAAAIASGNTLEAVAANAALRKFPHFDVRLRRVRDAVAFVGIAACSASIISATIGVAALCASAVQPWERFGSLWLDWWLGDALGALVIAPALLAAVSEPWSRRRAAEALVFVSLSVTATQIVFGRPLGLASHPLEFIIFPVVIAATVVSGPAVTSATIVSAAALAIWHTARGAGPFAGPDLHQSLVLLQTFMGVLAATALLLAAALAERHASEQRAKDAAAVLQHREEMLRLAQHAGGVATFEWDFRREIANCSAEFFQTFGLPAQDGQITGAQWAQFVHPDDRNRMGEHLARVIGGQEAATADYRIITVDGITRWLTYAGQLERTRDGDRLLGVVVDITERKHAEAALRQEVEVRTMLAQVGASLAGELRTEKLLQAVTETATKLTTAEFGAFFYNVTDEGGDSYSLHTIAGAAKETFAGFPHPRATQVFGPTFRGESCIRLDDVTKDSRFGQNAPFYGMPPGHLPVRSYLAVPVVARGGVVLGGLFFGHGQPGVFTERHELLATGVAAWAAIGLDNARLYQEVEQANRLKDDFLATLSHELRTPLNAVLGWAHMLRDGSIKPALRQKALESVERNARAQAQLVEDLLDVSRIVAGKLDIKADAVDLGPVVTNAVDTVRAGVSAKRLHLTVNAPVDRRIIVTGDADRLQQIVWNLVSNAVKFTPSGGRVDVELRQVDSAAEIVVRDTGQGIDPKLRPFLFQRFRQLDASKTRVHGGLGLGLSIVRHLAEAHGGTVTAESDGEGRGSTFRVVLPARAEAQITPARPARDQSPD